MPLRMVQWSDVRSLVRTEACGGGRTPQDLPGDNISGQTQTFYSCVPPCERLKMLKEVSRVVFPLSGLTRNFLGKPPPPQPPPQPHWLNQAAGWKTHSPNPTQTLARTRPLFFTSDWSCCCRVPLVGGVEEGRRAELNSSSAAAGQQGGDGAAICSHLQAEGDSRPSIPAVRGLRCCRCLLPRPLQRRWEWPGGRSGRGLLGSACTSLNGCGSPALGVHRERTH